MFCVKEVFHKSISSYHDTMLISDSDDASLVLIDYDTKEELTINAQDFQNYNIIGVVWRYGSRYFNLLSILIYVDLNYCNITNCSKLVLYSSKGSSLKYIITFNKPQFKVFFSKLRLKTNNFERGLIL